PPPCLSVLLVCCCCCCCCRVCVSFTNAVKASGSGWAFFVLNVGSNTFVSTRRVYYICRRHSRADVVKTVSGSRTHHITGTSKRQAFQRKPPHSTGWRDVSFFFYYMKTFQQKPDKVTGSYES
ncbi:AGAP010166-PA, partial [Anopheles gambiae str. PEST]